MKSKHWWVSYLALLVSLSALGFVLFRVVPVYEFNTQSYIGTFVSLLGICVALVLGSQIMNVIEWKDELKEMKIMKKDLILLKNNLTLTECLIWAEMCNTSASADEDTGDWDMALGGHIESLYYLFKGGDPKNNIETCYINIEKCLTNLTSTDVTKWNNHKNIINNLSPIDNVKKQIDNILRECNGLLIYKRDRRRFEQIVLSFNNWQNRRS